MRFVSTAKYRFCSFSSSNHFLGFLRSSSSSPVSASAATAALSSHSSSPSGGGGGNGNQHWRFMSWPSALLPIAFAASASYFYLDQRHSPAHCDSVLDHRYGGMETTNIREEVYEVFIDELRNILQNDMTVDYDERYFHGKPQNSFHKSANVPDVVVYPSWNQSAAGIGSICRNYSVQFSGHLCNAKAINVLIGLREKAWSPKVSILLIRSQDDVQKIIIACNKYKVPIVPYGGATSIEGHTLATNGGVCIDMSMMKEIKALHIEDMDVVVEPGIGWMELNEYLKPYGLFFPLDPGPGATIGGMCATRCSGSLAVVLGNGDVVKTAARARKSAAGSTFFWSCTIRQISIKVILEKYIQAFPVSGDAVNTFKHTPFRYDLTRLMIGSEGTLGVITEVTLRLQRLPQHSVVAMCNFPTVKDAADVSIATMLSGIQVSRVELLDEVMMHAINIANGKKLPEVPTLMFEFAGTEAQAREQTLLVQKIVSEHNGSDFVYVEDPEAKIELWKIRKEALWACFAMAPNFEAMITDVCVPLSKLADCISKSKQILDASSLLCTVIAHAGDGNFHTLILFDPEQEEQKREAERLNHFMVHTALSMEGTCTGEHGVGTGKMKYLEEELGMAALQTMKRIKTALDPNSIMNPGKIIPPHVCI
ncbi:D-lactate dehydrogenase [cytochrome], mitochondrial isoform X2 [Phalaenopsis equestris]|uniref:D-lactate dehydrogenase [cytochrome], mitochondrial isoform X2 n=1 Tax=Phalaenopsis equestris TaxID=78828 RepID=UPI0009E1E607|nr:D-lactate dehydrogenase [cytochrome], mitochondrial isoform X2 [Phalaenopsis equestris]